MLKDILAISGYGGLYKYLKKSRNGIIVENLETQKRMNADPSARINSLEDISIYTENGDMELKEVFKAIRDHEEGGKALNPKKAKGAELKAYFAEVIPDYDEERVYTSDIKKILTWYNTLQALDMLNFEESTEEQEENREESDDSGGSEKESEDNN